MARKNPMGNKFRTLLTAVLVFQLGTGILCGDSVYLGYTGYVSGSSKAIGMGGAFTGIADDVNSIIYNPAGFMFSSYKNYASFNYATFTDKSLDLNKARTDDIWRSQSFSFGMLHRRRDGNFVWGIYGYNPYTLIITNDVTQTENFVLPIGKPGESYLLNFSLGAMNIPMIWRLKEDLSVALTWKMMGVGLTYHQKTATTQTDLAHNLGALALDGSAMYKIRDNIMLGISISPPMYFNMDETLNDRIQGFKWFYDVAAPLQINTGIGYKPNERMVFDFDIDYTKFRGDEILVGSNLTPDITVYRLERTAVISPHLGGEYKTILWSRDLYIRLGYYYQPNLFEGLESMNHVTFSVSWDAIKLPKFLLFPYLSLGYSKDIADKYDVQTITLDSGF